MPGIAVESPVDVGKTTNIYVNMPPCPMEVVFHLNMCDEDLCKCKNASVMPSNNGGKEY